MKPRLFAPSLAVVALLAVTGSAVWGQTGGQAGGKNSGQILAPAFLERHCHACHAGGRFTRHFRHILERFRHVADPDRQGCRAAGFTAAETLGLIEPDPGHAD